MKRSIALTFSSLNPGIAAFKDKRADDFTLTVMDFHYINFGVKPRLSKYSSMSEKGLMDQEEIDSMFTELSMVMETKHILIKLTALT